MSLHGLIITILAGVSVKVLDLYWNKWKALQAGRGLVVHLDPSVNRSPHDPIERSEEDTLNRSELARLLAEALVFTPESSSMVVALYGEYGTGKTSTINLCLEELAAKNQTPVVVRFEPWLYSTTGELYFRFFQHLGTTLESEADLTGMRGQLVGYGKMATPIGGMIDLMGGGGVGAAFGKAISVASEQAERARQRNAQDPVRLKAEIERRILESGKHILVVIDDLDRLSSEEIRDVFRLVKAVADFPNTRYLLAFDFATATEALSKVQGTDGTRYLEKIVQVPFRLPDLAPGQLVAFVRGRVEELVSQTEKIGDEEREKLGEDFALLKYLDFDELWENMRQVNRFIDTLRLTLPAVAGEVRLRDLLVLEALRICQPAVYQRLISVQGLLVGPTPGASTIFPGRAAARTHEEAQAATKAAAESVVSVATREELRLVVGRLLEELFPRVQAARRNFTGFGTDFVAQWTSERRVCLPELFRTATAWALPSGVVSASEVEELLRTEDPCELRALLLAYDEDARVGIDLVSVLGRLSVDYLGGEEGRDPRPMLGAIFGIPAPGARYYAIGRTCFDVLKQLRREEGPEAAKALILQSLTEYGPTPGLVIAIRAIGREHGWQGRSPWPAGDRILGDEGLREVCVKISELLAREASEGTLLDRDVFDHYLYLWEEADGTAGPKGFLTGVVNDGKQLLALLRSYTERSDLAYNDRALVPRGEGESRRVVLQTQLLHNFDLLKSAAATAKELLSRSPEWLGDEHRTLLDAFLAYAVSELESPGGGTPE